MNAEFEKSPSLYGTLEDIAVIDSVLKKILPGLNSDFKIWALVSETVHEDLKLDLRFIR